MRKLKYFGGVQKKKQKQKITTKLQIISKKHVMYFTIEIDLFYFTDISNSSFTNIHEILLKEEVFYYNIFNCFK